MTREEKIRNAIDTIFPIPSSEKGRKYEQALMAIGFEAGVKWADKNPKSPWISVKDDLPCNHKEMIKVVVEDADTYTDRVLVMTDKGTMTIAYMYKVNSWLWYWSETERVAYWMPIPKLEEE